MNERGIGKRLRVRSKIMERYWQMCMPLDRMQRRAASDGIALPA